MLEGRKKWDSEFIQMLINNSRRVNLPEGYFTQGEFQKKNVEGVEFLLLDSYEEDRCHTCICCMKCLVCSPVILLSCCCIVKPNKVWHCHGLKCHQTFRDYYLFCCLADMNRPFLIWIKNPKSHACIRDCMDSRM